MIAWDSYVGSEWWLWITISKAIAYMARIYRSYVITLFKWTLVFVCFQPLDLAYVRSSVFLTRLPIPKRLISNLYNDFIVGCGEWTKGTLSYYITRVNLIHPTQKFDPLQVCIFYKTWGVGLVRFHILTTTRSIWQCCSHI